MAVGFAQFVSFRSSSFVTIPSPFSSVFDDEEEIGNGDRMDDEEQVGPISGNIVLPNSYGQSTF
jgi:hypothetical protein